MPLAVGEEVSGATLPLPGHGAAPDILPGKQATGESKPAEVMRTSTNTGHERQVDGTYRGPGTPPPYDNNRVAPSPDALDVSLPAGEEPWTALNGVDLSRPLAASREPPQDSDMTPGGVSLFPTSAARSGEEESPEEVVSSDQRPKGAGPHANDSHTLDILPGPNPPASAIMQGQLQDSVCNGGQPGPSTSHVSASPNGPLPCQDGASAGQPLGVDDADDDDDDFGTFADAEQQSELHVNANRAHMPLDSHATNVARGSEAECTEHSAFPDLSGSVAAEHQHPQRDTGASWPSSTTEQGGVETTEQGRGGEAEGERPGNRTGSSMLSAAGDLYEPELGVVEPLGGHGGSGTFQRAGEDDVGPCSGQPPAGSSPETSPAESRPDSGPAESDRLPAPAEGVLQGAGGAAPLPGAAENDSSGSQDGQLNRVSSGSDGAGERLPDDRQASAERLDLSNPLETSKDSTAGDLGICTSGEAADTPGQAIALAEPDPDSQGFGTSAEGAEAAGTPKQAIPLAEPDPDDDFTDFATSDEPRAAAPLTPDEDADSSDGFGGFEEAVEGPSALPQPGCESTASTPSLNPPAACPVPSSIASALGGSVFSSFDLLNVEDGELEGAIVKLVAPLVDEGLEANPDLGEPCLDGVRGRLESSGEATVLSAMPEAKPSAIAWSGTEAERGFLKRLGLSEAAEAAILQEQNKHELKKQRSRNGTGRGGRRPQASSMKRAGSAASRASNSGELQGSGELHRSGELGGSKELRFSGELRDTVGSSSLCSTPSMSKNPGPLTMGPLGYPTRSMDRGISLNRLSSIASSVSSRGSQSLGQIPSGDSPTIASDVRFPRSVSERPAADAGIPFAMWAMQQMRPQKRRTLSFEGGPASVPATPLSEFGSFSGFRMSREGSLEDTVGLRSLSSRGFSNGSAWVRASADNAPGTAQGFPESSSSLDGAPGAGTSAQAVGGPPGMMGGNTAPPVEGPVDPFARVFPTTGVVLMTAIADEYDDDDFEDFCEALPDEDRGGLGPGGLRDVGMTSAAGLGLPAGAAVGGGLSSLNGIAIPDLSWMFATKVQGPARRSGGR